MEMTESFKKDIINKAKDFDLGNPNIIISQGFAFENNSDEQAINAQLKEDIRFWRVNLNPGKFNWIVSNNNDYLVE